MKYLQRDIRSFISSDSDSDDSESSISFNSAHSQSLPSLQLENCEEIRLLDTVEVAEDLDGHCYATILRLWRDDSDTFAAIRWFYKPKDVFLTIPRFISRRELFDSNHEQTVFASTITRKVQVLTIEAYFWMTEKPDTAFFSRAVYLPQTQQLLPPFEDWDTICRCWGALNPDEKYVVCSECKAIFHRQCLETRVSEILWKCSNCDQSS